MSIIKIVVLMMRAFFGFNCLICIKISYFGADQIVMGTLVSDQIDKF